MDNHPNLRNPFFTCYLTEAKPDLAGACELLRQVATEDFRGRMEIRDDENKDVYIDVYTGDEAQKKYEAMKKRRSIK